MSKITKPTESAPDISKAESLADAIRVCRDSGWQMSGDGLGAVPMTDEEFARVPKEELIEA